MGFSCPKFLPKAPVAVVLAVLGGALCAQSQSQSGGAPPQEQQSSQPSQPSQQDPPQSAAETTTAAPPNQSLTSAAGSSALRLTFHDALELARKNSTQFQAAVTNYGVVREDRAQARDVLLPSVNYDNSAIYTQSSGPVAAVAGAPPVIFIANNAVHEYLSQANVHEAIDVASFANWRRSAAAASVARAQMEIAARGLVVTVAQNYYKVGAAERKLETGRRGAEEGDQFFKLTQELENGGEVAHADVIKAELQMQERHRQLQEAELGLLNARLDLAVLIFPNLNLNFEIADDLHAPAPLPTIEEIQQRGTHDNPDLRAALEAVRQARYDVFSARAGYFPALTFDYFLRNRRAKFRREHGGKSGKSKVFEPGFVRGRHPEYTNLELGFHAEQSAPGGA